MTSIGKDVTVMILQTGMRTDIPAFYSKWFINRIKEGYVLVRNPYDPTMLTKYSLEPSAVDLIAFCTKNPYPMLDKMDHLKNYGQYWFVTITPYEKEIEPKVPPKEKVMEYFKILSEKVDINSVGWRYDPIIVNSKYTVKRHLSDFEYMAKTLSGYTKTCVISFLDIYKKVEKNFPEGREVDYCDKMTIGQEFYKIGKKYGITIKACAEGNELSKTGIDCNGCMTVETYEKALGEKLVLPKTKNQRNNICSCFFGNDIGMYDSCGHMCRYCYANSNWDAVRRNMQYHDPDSPLLIGAVQPEDRIRSAEQISFIDRQLTLF